MLISLRWLSCICTTILHVCSLPKVRKWSGTFGTTGGNVCHLHMNDLECVKYVGLFHLGKMCLSLYATSGTIMNMMFLNCKYIVPHLEVMCPSICYFVIVSEMTGAIVCVHY